MEQNINGMSYEEMCKHLIAVINLKERKILGLLKKIPFEKLSIEEKGRVITAEIRETDIICNKSD